MAPPQLHTTARTAPQRTPRTAAARAVAKHPPTLLLIAAGLLQVRAVEAAHRLGLRVIAVDGNPHAPGFDALHEDDVSVCLSTKDVRAVVKYAQGAQRAGANLCGVYTEGAECAYTVAVVAERLGLPGTLPQAARWCDLKPCLRMVLAGVEAMPAPRFWWPEQEAWPSLDRRRVAALSPTYDQVLAAGAALGYPLIVKPADNAGSRGVRRVDSDSDLWPAVQHARSYASALSVLLEEYLEGPSEHSLDSIIARGRYYRAGICDRQFDYRHGYMLETSVLNPSQLPPTVQDRMYDLAERAGRALGITDGVIKCDFKLTDRSGPVILEMTNRLSGGFDAQYTKPYATGIDAITATIRIAVGRELDPADLWPKWHRACISGTPFPTPGRVVAIAGVEAARLLPGVRHVFVLTRVGEVVPPYRHCVTRPAFLIVEGATPAQAQERLDRALATIRIETAPLTAP